MCKRLIKEWLPGAAIGEVGEERTPAEASFQVALATDWARWSSAVDSTLGLRSRAPHCAQSRASWQQCRPACWCRSHAGKPTRQLCWQAGGVTQHGAGGDSRTLPPPAQ